MMTIGGSVGVFMAAADIVAPAYYYQSFEDYKRWNAENRPSKARKLKNLSLPRKSLGKDMMQWYNRKRKGR